MHLYKKALALNTGRKKGKQAGCEGDDEDAWWRDDEGELGEESASKYTRSPAWGGRYVRGAPSPPQPKDANKTVFAATTTFPSGAPVSGAQHSQPPHVPTVSAWRWRYSMW